MGIGSVVRHIGPRLFAASSLFAAVSLLAACHSAPDHHESRSQSTSAVRVAPLVPASSKHGTGTHSPDRAPRNDATSTCVRPRSAPNVTLSDSAVDGSPPPTIQVRETFVVTLPPANAKVIPAPVGQSDPRVLEAICRVLVPSEANVARGYPSFTVYGSRTALLAVRPGADSLYESVGPSIPPASPPGTGNVAVLAFTGRVVVKSG